MRRPLISGNWKMNLDRTGILNLCGAIKETVSSVTDVEVGVFPPFPYLSLVKETLENSGVFIGGQDLYFETQGAFTGQVSGPMLKDAGATHVLVGHSERRHLFGDTNEITLKKMQAALDAGLKPVLCVGEKLPEREADRTAEVVIRQIEEGTRDLSEESLKDLVVAYEPVWAIGTGMTATPEQAGVAHRIIRDWFGNSFSHGFAEKLRILYGGSVTPDNVDALMAVDGVDGALVGGASLKPELFEGIIRFNH